MCYILYKLQIKQMVVQISDSDKEGHDIMIQF